MITRFLNDESGHTAIEYGLLAAFISIVLVTSLGAISGTLTGWMDSARTAMDGQTGGGE